MHPTPCVQSCTLHHSNPCFHTKYLGASPSPVCSLCSPWDSFPHTLTRPHISSETVNLTVIQKGHKLSVLLQKSYTSPFDSKLDSKVLTHQPCVTWMTHGVGSNYLLWMKLVICLVTNLSGVTLTRRELVTAAAGLLLAAQRDQLLCSALLVSFPSPLCFSVW